MEAFRVFGGVKLEKENSGLTEYSCHLLVICRILLFEYLMSNSKNLGVLPLITTN